MLKLAISFLVGVGVIGCLRLAEGVEQLPHFLAAMTVPGDWLAKQFFRGQVVSFTSPDSAAFWCNVVFYAIATWVIVTVVERPAPRT